MNSAMKNSFGLVVCTLMLACTQADMEKESILAASQEKSQPEIVDSTPVQSNSGSEVTKKISAAVSDLSSRTGVAEDSIKVRHARAVNWGSSAVGCPRPGMEYMQVIVPGFQVLLEANGTVYRYHGERKGALFFCPEDRAQAPAYGSGEEVM